MKAIEDTEDNDMSLVVPSLFPNYIDEKYLNSLERDDIMTATATSQEPAQDGNNVSDDQQNKNPLYF